MNTLDVAAMRITRTAFGVKVEPPIIGLKILNACAVLPASPETGGMLRRSSRSLFARPTALADVSYAIAPRYQEPLLRQLLARVGAPVTVSGPVPTVWAPSEPPNGTVFLDTHMINAVARHERLLITYRAGSVSPAALVVQAVVAFKQKSVAVLVKTLDEATEITNLLTQAGVASVLFTRETPQNDGRSRVPVAVCTFSAAGHDDVALHHRDLVLVDALDALEERGTQALSSAGAARVVGFRPSDTPLSPTDAGRLLETYGPVEVHVPGHGLTTRAVVFGFAPVHGGNTLHNDMNIVELKTRGIWNNDLRTRRFAKLGTALATGNTAAVANFLPSAQAAMIPTRPCRVLMIVENAVHGNNVVNRVPADWEVRGAGLCRRQQSAHPNAGWGAPGDGARCSIVCTFEALKTLRLSEFDVVIRLDGGCGMLPLCTSALDTATDLPPVVIIDCDDRFHPDLAGAARQRQDEYRRAGWHRAGDPVGFDELERYLARHPDGDKYRRLLDDVARAVRPPRRGARDPVSSRRSLRGAKPDCRDVTTSKSGQDE